MSSYRAPLRDMSVRPARTRRHRRDRETSRLRGDGRGARSRCSKKPRRSQARCSIRSTSAGDREGCTWNDGEVTTPHGLQRGVQAVRPSRLDRLAGSDRVRRPRAAAAAARRRRSRCGTAPTSASPTARCSTKARSKRSNSCGSDEQKKTYIPKLVSGEWTGTMCLTEPQAGSDLAAVRTQGRARRRPLPDQRAEDLHHVRRARHGAEHHSPRSRAAARRARRHQGHLDVHRAESARQRRRHARRTQRRLLRGHRAQARASTATRRAR